MTASRMLALQVVCFGLVYAAMWLDRKSAEVQESGEALMRRRMGAGRPFKLLQDRST